MEATIKFSNEKVSKTDLVKAVLKIGVEAGVCMIAGEAIKKVAPDTSGKPLKKLAIFLGTTVLLGMLSAKADEYVDEQVDQAADAIAQLREGVEEAVENAKKTAEDVEETEEEKNIKDFLEAAKDGLRVVTKKVTEDGIFVEAEKEGS